MARKKHHEGRFGGLLATTALLLWAAPGWAWAAGGRHVGPSDRPPAGQHGPAQDGYGRAILYRSGEMPKPPDRENDRAKSDATPVPRKAETKQNETSLPVIIQGVPHRFQRHYSQTAC